MSVIWTPLRLVMEENARKEIPTSQYGVPTDPSNGRKIMSNKLRHDVYDRSGGGDCAGDYMKDIHTLPFRTETLRAQFQEKINQTLHEENKLVTTALVERPPFYSKEEFEQRKRYFNGGNVDTPDGMGPPDGHDLKDFQGSAELGSKQRPLFVRFPSLSKDNLNEEDKVSIKTENIEMKEYEQPNESVNKKQEFEQDIDNKSELDDENDCIVNCLYYTQQFCDCSIL